jgi:hypothetical protein
MSYVKITELPPATVPLDYTELTAIVQNNVTKNVPLNSIFSVNLVNFVGTGSQTTFLLPSAVSENATNIFINGVYQHKNTYQIAVDTLIFSQAPPITSKIEVMYA